MHHVLDIAGMTFALCSLFSSLYVVSFSIAGIRQHSRDRLDAQGTARCEQFLRFLLFVPAHNEADGIRKTIETALAQDYPRDSYRVITIADNCDDSTAAVAASFGSEVWTRADRQHCGKGFALSWAFSRGRRENFDLAAVVDADTEIDSQFLARMNFAAVSAGSGLDKKVFQGRYEFAAASAKPNWFETFTIASRAAENSFVYRPRSAAGLVNLLQGNGFCVPRTVLDAVPFQSTSIVEDADYAIELALRGVQVCYVDAARVVSRMTRSVRDAAPQRLRWATGIFQLMLRAVPRLILNGIMQRRWRLVEAALNLLLSSRLLIVYFTCCAIAIALMQPQQAGATVILSMVFTCALLQGVYLWLVFRKSADRALSLRGLLLMPAYIGIIGFSQAAALVGIRRKNWTRTVR